MAKETGPEQMAWIVPSTTQERQRAAVLSLDKYIRHRHLGNSSEKDLLNVSLHKGLQPSQHVNGPFMP